MEVERKSRKIRDIETEREARQAKAETLDVRKIVNNGRNSSDETKMDV